MLLSEGTGTRVAGNENSRTHQKPTETERQAFPLRKRAYGTTSHVVKSSGRRRTCATWLEPMWLLGATFPTFTPWDTQAHAQMQERTYSHTHMYWHAYSLPHRHLHAACMRRRAYASSRTRASAASSIRIGPRVLDRLHRCNWRMRMGDDRRYRRKLLGLLARRAAEQRPDGAALGRRPSVAQAACDRRASGARAAPGRRPSACLFGIFVYMQRSCPWRL